MEHFGSLFLSIAYFICYSFGYIELIAGNHLGNSGGSSDHSDSSFHHSGNQFLPQIAFQCGYRNRYMNKQGEWESDKDINAVCLTGKLDILKYCKKVYPELKITNFVQAEDLVTINDWCKAGEGRPCKWSFLTRPYRCIVGEFESEALLVPQGCHFGHVDDRSKCNDFQFWNLTAQLECAKRLGDLKVQSFAMLQPCGLDLFNGVEYVCCPKQPLTPDLDLHVKVKLEKVENSSGTTTPKSYTFDDDDSSEEDDDDEDEGDDEDEPLTTSTQEAKKKPTKSSAQLAARSRTAKPLTTTTTEKTPESSTTTENFSSEEEDEIMNENSKSEEQDIYFRIADPDFEHDRYREALERLEKKHRSKVAKVMKQWSNLETRYQSMLQKDPKGAQSFKNVITKRFQTTVAALEEENREERRQIEDVHEQRVDALLNERKRESIKRFRDALADPKPSVDRILHGLKAYVRAEEKDRFHQLNRYRRLLKRDSDLASETKPQLLRRLRDIDLRINGTVGLLKELPPKLETELKTDIQLFWQTLRAQNTPKVDDEGLLKLDYSLNSELVDEYKRQYQEKNAAKQQEKIKIAVDRFVSPTPISTPDPSTPAPNLPTFAPEVVAAKAVVKKLETLVNNGMIIDEKTGRKIQEQQENNDSAAPVKKLLSPSVVVFDPVVEIADDFKDDETPQYSFARKSVLQQPASMLTRHSPMEDRGGYAYVVIGLAGVTLLVSLVLGVAFVRRRYTNRGRGFIEVDACTPEERHVAMMQGNGYENPTYKYFDEKM